MGKLQTIQATAKTHALLKILAQRERRTISGQLEILVFDAAEKILGKNTLDVYFPESRGGKVGLAAVFAGVDDGEEVVGFGVGGSGEEGGGAGVRTSLPPGTSPGVSVDGAEARGRARG